MLKNKIKTLIDLIEGTEVQEIEVSSFWGAQKIKLNKGGNQKPQVVIQKESNDDIAKEETAQSIYDETEKTSKDLDIDSKQEEVKIDKTISSQNLHELKAPLVGTYYSSPKPDSPQFVNVGDKVSQGQTVCIIEAMKIFNEIESDVNGIVSEICIENGKPVEFDQLILKIKPE